MSPRLGFAWSPTGSRHTVVRGSAGLSYDRVPLRAVANALLSAGNTTNISNLRQISISLSPAQTGAPAFPNILTAPVPSGHAVEFDDNGSAHAERVFAAGQHRNGAPDRRPDDRQRRLPVHAGRGSIISVNQNVPACVAGGTNNGCRPNPAYANNSQYSPLASSVYHGLHVSFVGRPAEWGYYRVSYTLSKAMDNVGEFFFSSPIDPFDLVKDWGRSDDDQRHRFVVTVR